MHDKKCGRSVQTYEKSNKECQCPIYVLPKLFFRSLHFHQGVVDVVALSGHDQDIHPTVIVPGFLQDETRARTIVNLRSTTLSHVYRYRGSQEGRDLHYRHRRRSPLGLNAMYFTVRQA